MKFSSKILDRLSVILLAVALLLQIVPPLSSGWSGSLEASAGRAGRKLERRMALLEKYSSRPLFDGGDLPSDMVIYRYADDTLQVWENQFTIADDDIRRHVDVPRLTNPRTSNRAPLSELGDTLSFCNFGSKWYLVKSFTDGNVRTFLGLEILNSLERDSRYGNVVPLSVDGGVPVRLGETPVFKVADESAEGRSVPSCGWAMWLSVICFIAAVTLFLSARRTVARFGIAVAAILSSAFSIWIWGMNAGADFKIFSPGLYADGPMFYSLGSILIINSVISFLLITLYIVRGEIRLRINGTAGWIAALAVSVLIIGYSYISLRSLVLNSTISLELYRFHRLSAYTAVVYSSYLILFSSIPLLWRILSPYSGKPSLWMAAYVLLLSASIVTLTFSFGSRKEQARLEVLAGRLSIDRDIPLELQLRRVEDKIAEDPFIASLLLLDNSEYSIENRLKENYFPRLAQQYDIRVLGEVPEFQTMAPVVPDSRFLYRSDSPGRPVYVGVFFYNVRDAGLVRLVFSVAQKEDAKSSGYASIMGVAPIGKVVVPRIYSCARYKGRGLMSFKGNYVYPVVMDDKLFSQVYETKLKHLSSGGYEHFLYNVVDGESVIISRPSVSFFTFVTEFLALALILFLLLRIPDLFEGGRKIFEKNYYRKRISLVLMASLCLTLVVMALVSVLFVINRNESNLSDMMSEKISSIQSMVQSRLRTIDQDVPFRSPAVTSILEDVALQANSDITMYTTDGRILLSTSAIVFDSGVVGSRMNGDAFDNVVRKGKRYFIHKERIGTHSFYNMYAPVFSRDGGTVAIISSPYTEQRYWFKRDALTHAAAIIVLFAILLLLTRFTVTGIIDRLFKPISEIGEKMEKTDLDTLEMLDYDRNDELLSLVNAYNRMVTELSVNSQKLAQAERDKAWSGMARQVAHEIKNPLTPMKLQLQRIIRLKQRNDPSWQEKFDDMSGVILEHIDILTDTANEFSTFARLYAEEPTEIDLNALLSDEVSMYDSRGDLHFEYFGLPGVVVSGPKPQLTRVFVNLINNAVQAVEGAEDARVMVSLRKSDEDGWYDIVVEDNGPGVARENIDKLFTPNFTTKSGGSGLGLAISRSIIEKCGASISYSKSFVLGGACFTVHYPSGVTSGAGKSGRGNL